MRFAPLALALLAASAAPAAAEFQLRPECVPATLRARMLAHFDRGVPLENDLLAAGLCYERPSSGGVGVEDSDLVAAFYQNLDALTYDARLAAHVQGGYSKETGDAELERAAFAQFVRLARGELSRDPRNAPDLTALVAAYSRPRSAETIDTLRERLALVKMLRDDAGNPFNDLELARLIQGPSTTLARLETERRRVDPSLDVHRVTDGRENFLPARPVTTALLDWNRVRRYVDAKTGIAFAQELRSRAAPKVADVHTCYQSFKTALDAVQPGVMAVSPVGGADDWYPVYDHSVEHLSYARLRRIDPMTVPWTDSSDVTESRLAGMILNYDADCPENFLSAQTALSGHIEAIVPDEVPPADGPRASFRVCAEACRDVTAAKLTGLSSLSNPRGGACLHVYAFVGSSPSAYRPKPAAAHLTDGTGYGPERIKQRQDERAEIERRLRERLGQLEDR